MRFLLVGALATGVQYLILIALVELIAIDETIASTIGFVISSIVNYRVNYSFTFSSTLPHYVAYPKFLTTAVIGLLINSATIYTAVNVLGVYYLFAQVAATCLTLIWNFTINSIWSFGQQLD